VEAKLFKLLRCLYTRKQFLPNQTNKSRSSLSNEFGQFSNDKFLQEIEVNHAVVSALPSVQSSGIVCNITTLEQIMEKPVTATDANRKFSKLLRSIREGHSYVVTSHGKAVAKIVPVDKNATVTPGARSALLKRLRSEPVVTIGRWSRSELYEDEQ